jgi:hypothetical protein
MFRVSKMTVECNAMRLESVAIGDWFESSFEQWLKIKLSVLVWINVVVKA